MSPPSGRDPRANNACPWASGRSAESDKDYVHANKRAGDQILPLARGVAGGMIDMSDSGHRQCLDLQ